MMTLIARLCTLCAMSALMQMSLPDQRERSSLRMICGLLMLKMAAIRIQEIGSLLMQQTELSGIFECLMS